MIKFDLRMRESTLKSKLQCTWAHLIHMKKHTSYDEPPNKRFWELTSSGTGATGVTTSGATEATNSGASTEATTSGSSGVATFKSVSASLGKRVNL